MSDRRIHFDQTYSSDLALVRPIQDDIEQGLQTNRFGDSDIFAIKLAVEEALVNAIKHGNQLDPTKHFRVAYNIDDKHFDITIYDEGPGFSPEDVPDPREECNLDRPCGRGVFIIRHFMSTVEYQGRGNIVAMTKERSPEE
jgi:serine/threonine-protein kinase RsbW